MKKPIWLRSRYSLAAMIAVVIAVGFQNCGGFSANGLSGSQAFSSLQFAKVTEGSGVREAGLLGRNVLKSSSTTVASARAQSTELVSCNADNSSCLVENMPLLNQFKMPTPFASMYCAPTAAGMIFESMLNSGFTFPRNEGPTFVAQGDAVKRVLWLGGQMKTDDRGSYEHPQMLALDSLIFAASPTYDLKSFNTVDITPEAIKSHFSRKGMAAMNYGHFYVPKASTLISGRQVSKAESTGGHAIALAGFKSSTSGQTEIVYNDPGDETQYARVLERHAVNREDGVYVVYPWTSPDGNSSSFALFSADYGAEKYIALITKYLPMEPSNRNVPAPTPVVNPQTDARAAAQQAVTESYLVLLKRLPEPAGLEAGIAYLLAGHSRTQFEDMIRSSQEYKNLNPAPPAPQATPAPTPKPTPAPASFQTDALVQDLFQRLLQRSAEPAARVYASSKNCQGIGSMVAHSTEAFGHYNNQNNDAFVRYLYQGVLARSGSASEVAHWVAQLSSSMDRNQVISEFVNSPEFSNRCAALGVR